jgi:hypothetical protein
MDRSVALGVMIVAMAAFSLPARAQTPAAAPAIAAPAGPTTLPSVDISKETRTSSNPQSDAAAIDAFINANVQNLMSNNPGAQQIGRDKLERAIAGVGSSNAPSPAFVNYYVAQLDKALLPAIQSKNVRTRLNAGILIHRVTVRSQDTQLQNLALILMKDKTDAVALWGIKCAGAMIPTAVAGGTATVPPMLQLIQSISKAADGRTSSALVQEAYQALSLGVPDIKIPLAGAGPVIDEIENVLAGRLKKYVIGIPEDPASDRLAVTFLTNEKIIAVLTPAQKTRALQMLSDLIQLGAGQFANATTLPDKDQLAYIVSFAARGLQVAAAPPKGGPLEDALIKVSKINRNSPPAQALADVKAMFVLLQKAFPELKPAPGIVVATTAPTTAPTTALAAPAAPTAPVPAAAGAPVR